jgi:hypothetical protein
MEYRPDPIPTSSAPILSFNEVFQATPTPGNPSDEELIRFGQNVLREPLDPDNPHAPFLSPEDQAAFTHDRKELTELWRMAMLGGKVLDTLQATDSNAN